MRVQSEKVRRREKRRRRSKNLFPGQGGRNRLVVYRSLKHIYAQIVNDLEGKTVVSASTLEKEIRSRFKDGQTKVEKSEIVGRVLAERAKAKRVRKVVFDRNGFLYHGRVKALAEGARAGGLEF